MLSNLDLILLSFFHASFICFILLIIIFIILLALLVSSSFALLSISLLDLHHFSSLLCEYFKMVKGDLELGIVLTFIYLIKQALNYFLVSKPWPRSMVNEFQVIKAQQYSTSSSIHVLKTILSTTLISLQDSSLKS
ncbi:hypothetical protein Lalb_Chr22g0352241 [Lupinus albus]|uniref:Transmembrane protein n=1 Tax=Lupinus albus TaxID=3870 RepID=A0A6A4NFC0_LUPAL|nr:hypothetical protein Lalb_Chr22g0352241 [Lupinus albus]